MAAYALAVHGGAWNIPDALWPAHQAGCKAARQAGLKVLAAGGSALDAICTAIGLMEEDPIFDAGTGSFLDRMGRIGLDAGLMEGHGLRGGGVLGVSRVKSPIALARIVAEETEHCLFTRDGAHALAERAGLDMVPEDYHIIPRELALYEQIRNGDRSPLEEAWRGCDTVGAVALDREGNLAAGNSTGGTLYRQPGRIGDAALIGVGFYADNEIGAVVCTGWGESIMRAGMARFGSSLIADLGPQTAAERAVAHLASRVGGHGGILTMTPKGEVGVAYNTERMAFRTA